jgi:hypothetical protein
MPITKKYALFSLAVSTFATGAAALSRFFQFGMAKVVQDWYIYFGFFIFLLVFGYFALLVSSKIPTTFSRKE